MAPPVAADTDSLASIAAVLRETLTVLGFPALAAGVATFLLKRRQAREDSSVEAERDLVQLRANMLEGISKVADEGIKRALEANGALIIELQAQLERTGQNLARTVAAHEECEARIDQIEAAARERRARLDGRIDVLERALRIAGVPPPEG